jgi:hypothetical protein
VHLVGCNKMVNQIMHGLNNNNNNKIYGDLLFPLYGLNMMDNNGNRESRLVSH